MQGSGSESVLPLINDVIFLTLQADSDRVLPFSQTFYLKQIGDSLFVMNDIFRLALHHQ